MKRTNYHDFGLVPSVSFRRSKFSMNHGNKTSFNVGELVPLDVVEVIPGDTFSTKMTGVVRATTSFIRPIMDNLFLDVYHFFVPNRLVYDNSEQVFGKANPSMYVDEQLDEYPTLPKCTISSKSVGDYLGLPLGKLPSGINVLPFRAFALIYNQWFRNENIVDETYVQTGGLGASELPNNDEWSPINYFGKLPKVGKRKDYFTSALPKPQKGQPVSLGLTGTAPVVNTELLDGIPSAVTPLSLLGRSTANLYGVNNLGGDTAYTELELQNRSGNSSSKENLYLDLSDMKVDLTGIQYSNINDLRFAFQLQKMLERDSLYGSRYNEYLMAHYGVSSPDSRLQFTEFLGGGRIPIQIQQVASTYSGQRDSVGNTDSPLAEVGAYSLSVGESKFVKGFVEHGFVVTVACCRQIHTYQQGIEKMWTRKSRNDFYDPLFANLGEQPIYESQLFGNVDELKGNVFGYNEAWAEYRYIPNRITGQMRSTSGSDLDVWHLADVYENAPTLSDDFINENSKNIDRVLTAPSSSIDNFIMDMYFETDAIRVMPVYSVPGLIDHH